MDGLVGLQMASRVAVGLEESRVAMGQFCRKQLDQTLLLVKVKLNIVIVDIEY
jgi:hypothetical protein